MISQLDTRPDTQYWKINFTSKNPKKRLRLERINPDQHMIGVIYNNNSQFLIDVNERLRKLPNS